MHMIQTPVQWLPMNNMIKNNMTKELFLSWSQSKGSLIIIQILPVDHTSADYMLNDEFLSDSVQWYCSMSTKIHEWNSSWWWHDN